MRIKPDWHMYLHGLRREEIEMIFSRCPRGLFQTALELGAGDGYQSTLLSRYARTLVSSDLNFLRLGRPQNGRVFPLVCDAEAIGVCFQDRSFDLVFSSNLLEHLPEPEGALRGTLRILKDDGVAIHVVPSPFLKVCYLLLHNPNRVVCGLERRIGRERRDSPLQDASNPPARLDNNLKLPIREPPSRWLPVPHGVSRTHHEEFRAFRKATWIRRLERAGFEVVAVRRGVVCSGYGFGLDRTRRVLKRLRFCSAYAYVAVKQGMASPHLRYLMES